MIRTRYNCRELDKVPHTLYAWKKITIRLDPADLISGRELRHLLDSPICRVNLNVNFHRCRALKATISTASIRVFNSELRYSFFAISTSFPTPKGVKMMSSWCSEIISPVPPPWL